MRRRQYKKVNGAVIYHIARYDDWQNALSDGEYAADSLQSEGFIHCSTLNQLLMAANNFFAGQTDLVLLKIDPKRVRSSIQYEDLYQSGDEFPHIYGPLNLDAVVSTHDFAPDPEGAFHLPE